MTPSPLSIRAITNASHWNDFLLALRPNTFLQSWEWGQLQKQSGEGIRYLGFFAGDEQIGAALLITVNAKRGRHLFCPHGPLFTTDPAVRQRLPAFVDHCRNLARQDKAVALRLAPLLLTNNANVTAFKSLGFRPAPMHIHAERTWNLDLAEPDPVIFMDPKQIRRVFLNIMRKTTRHAIKKAERMSIQTDIVSGPDIINRFLPLYRATEERHHFIPFTKDFLSRQINIFSQNNNVYAIFASYQGRDIVAAILIQFGNTVFYHHGASLKQEKIPPASHLVQWEAIKEAKRRGATRYNFWGIAPKRSNRAARNTHPFAGITVFKQGFGGYDQDYLHAQDLPLSPLYYRLWLVETVRRIRRGF